jgi:hypothetical protein
MATPIDHTQDMKRRETRTKRSLLPFALLVVLAAVLWLAFTKYL